MVSTLSLVPDIKALRYTAQYLAKFYGLSAADAKVFVKQFLATYATTR